jgi:hypothetical protein
MATTGETMARQDKISVRQRLRLVLSVAATMLVAGSGGLPAGVGAARAGPPSPPADEAAFLAANKAAMDRMMAAMKIAPTGDVDRDFVAMMVPHHQGAIEMAEAVLRHGRNEQIRRLAQEIVVTQQQEIAAMRLAIGDPLPPSVPAPTAAGAAPAHHP